MPAPAAGKAYPREFRLAALCCRWPLSGQALAAIRASSEGAIDWDYALRIVQRQRIAGLVSNALSSAQVGLPPAAAAALAAQAQRIARQNLSLAAETARLQRAFDAAEIAVVVLKGVALAQLAYGTLALKHGKDIDLLVPPARAEEALRYLERLGYVLLRPAGTLSDAQRRAVVRFGNEFALGLHGREPQVELRWRLTDNELLVTGIEPFARTQTLALSDDVRLRTLGEADLFAYLCVHGASHAWSRLKWLADVNALIARKDEAEIERLYRHAQATGSGLCAGQALLLCRQLLGLPLSARLDEELGRSRRLRLLTAIAMSAMVGPDAETEIEDRRFGSTRVALMQFLLGRGPAYVLAQCRIFSVRLGDVVHYPLPRPLHFLYPVLRLPLWLWRRARRLGGNEPLQAPKRR